jgi:acyl carrier protein
MDAFVSQHNQASVAPWISVNWDGWLLQEDSTLAAAFQTSIDQFAMAPQESLEAFRRVICCAQADQLIVSTGDLAMRLDVWIRRAAGGDAPANGSAPLHPRPEIATIYVPPENDIEQTIVTIWQELLGIEQLGVYDNFFDLGGNSLIGLKVIARLKQALQIDIPIVALFEGPTVRALVNVIGQAGHEQPAYDQRRSRGERRRERRRQQITSAEVV